MSSGTADVFPEFLLFDIELASPYLDIYSLRLVNKLAMYVLAYPRAACKFLVNHRGVDAVGVIVSP